MTRPERERERERGRGRGRERERVVKKSSSLAELPHTLTLILSGSWTKTDTKKQGICCEEGEMGRGRNMRRKKKRVYKGEDGEKRQDKRREALVGRKRIGGT